MEAYSQKPVTFMYFWLNYCDGNHHIERIPVYVKNIGHLFHLASEIIKADRLHLFLLSDGTRIVDNEYLESLENGAELIVCTEKQIQKLLIYFELKRYLSFKNISHLLNIDYFNLNNFDVHRSCYKQYKFSLYVFIRLFIYALFYVDIYNKKTFIIKHSDLYNSLYTNSCANGIQ